MVAAILALGLAVLAVPSTMAGDNGNQSYKAFKVDSVVYGRTYADWMAAWDQWTLSIPVANHPLFDNGDCSVGQSGPVWFLGGNFVPPGTRVRHCTVPYGKALFFPVVDWEDSALEEALAEHPGDPAFQQIIALRTFVESGLQTYISGPYCTVDGVRLPHFPDGFKVQSTVFGVTIPDDNLWTAAYGINFPAGTYFPSVDDGWDVMLAPLPPGDHVLHFGSNVNDITYYLHVTK